jgi:hypothetical protein
MEIDADVQTKGSFHIQGYLGCDPVMVILLLALTIALFAVSIHLSGAGFSLRSFNPWTLTKHCFAVIKAHPSDNMATLLYAVLAFGVLFFAGFIVSVGACLV